MKDKSLVRSGSSSEGQSPNEPVSKAKLAGLKRGQLRTDAVRQKVLEAMSAIELEIHKNHGVFPRNDGEVTLAEVARCAGIHPTTFYTPKLESLGNEVREWSKKLSRVGVELGPDVSAKRKSVAKLYEELGVQHSGLLQSHRDTELALQQLEHDVQMLRTQVNDLQDENEKLKSRLSTQSVSAVVPLRKK